MEPNTAPDAPGAPAGSSPASPPATPGQQQVDPAQEQSWIERQVTNAINGWLATLAAGALDPLARLAGALIDPKYWIGIEQVHQLWLNSAVIANGVYVLLVLAGGVLVMTHQSVQTRYAVKQVAPRLVLGWVAANLSWALIGAAVQFALALALAVAGNGMTPAEILVRLLAAKFAGGPIFLILLILIVTVLAVALVLGLIVTEALFLVLVICAPLALCLHALPQTEAVALLWWRCMGAALSVPVLDGLILALLGRIVLTPGSFGAFFLPSFVTAAGTLLHLLVVTALLWLMLKIPRAVFRAATATQHRRGRGVIRTVLRSALIYSALRTGGIGPALGTAAKTAGKTGPLATAIGALLGTTTKPGTATAGAGTPGGPNPYQQTHTTGGGQYLLPLRGVRPRSRRLAGEGPPNPANPTATRRYLATHSGGTATATGPRAPARPGRAAQRGRQLEMPLADGWPEDRPVAGRDGQYRLPIPVTRTRPTGTQPPAQARPGPAAQRGRQLVLPLAHGWPEDRPVLGRDGQYQLPIPVTRRVPPAARPAPAPVRPPAGRTSAAEQQPRLPDIVLARPRPTPHPTPRPRNQHTSPTPTTAEPSSDRERKPR